MIYKIFFFLGIIVNYIGLNGEMSISKYIIIMSLDIRKIWVFNVL